MDVSQVGCSGGNSCLQLQSENELYERKTVVLAYSSSCPWHGGGLPCPNTQGMSSGQGGAGREGSG